MRNFDWEAPSKPAVEKTPTASKAEAPPRKSAKQRMQERLTHLWLILSSNIEVVFAVGVAMMLAGMWLQSDLRATTTNAAIASLNSTSTDIAANMGSFTSSLQRQSSRISTLETQSNAQRSQLADASSKLNALPAAIASGDNASMNAIAALTSRTAALESKQSTILALMGNLSVTLFKKDNLLPNGSMAPPIAALARYADLQCYKDYRSQGWGQYFDPESVCNQARAGIPDYVAMAEGACSCAAAGCRTLLDAANRTICLNSLGYVS